MWVPLRCCANNAEKETSMSRFQKGSHVTWHSQYHLEKEQHDEQQVQLEPRSNDQVTFSEGPLGVPPLGGIRQNRVLRTRLFTSADHAALGRCARSRLLSQLF